MNNGTERVRPLLSYLADSQQKSTRAVTDAVADEFGSDRRRVRSNDSERQRKVDEQPGEPAEFETATDAEIRAMEAKLIRETGANNPAIGYNRSPRYRST